MSGARTVRFLSLSALAATTALIGTGWSLHAIAGQGKPRPFVPRPSDLRPLSRGQEASPPAIPLPGAKAPASLTPPAGKSDSPKPKLAGFDCEDPTVEEKTGVITGRDFTYKEEDMVVTGAKAHYNKNTKVLDADGNLVLDDPKHHVTGDKAHVDNSRKGKLAIITGSVIIVLKPKDKPVDAPANDVADEKGKGGTITCDRVDDYYKKEFVILSGHLTFKQKIAKKDGHMVERTLTADHAEYDGKNDKMHLFAPVDVKDTENQEAHFQKDVYVGTKEGEETLKSDGPAKFIFLVDEDKDDSGDTAGDKPPATAGGKSAGAGKQGSPPAETDKKQDTPVKKNP